MAKKLHNISFPNESVEYRQKRDDLLRAELALRKSIEDVAKARREIPFGGKVKQDYIFERMSGGDVKLSELFKDNKDTLILYSFMYGPNMENPCPACTSIIDGFNGYVHHLEDRLNFYVIAKSPINRLQTFAESRNWTKISLLSSEKNSYNLDYFAETEKGSQMPMCNVFIKKEDAIFHFWGSEMLFASSDGHPRHMDLMWPIWNFLDITPEGRGTDWSPKISY